jgi:predicted DNA-binding transcriptional regulator AlpA
VADQIDSISIIRNKELARRLGVSEVTLWRMRSELPPKVRISKGVQGWRASDISRWLESRQAAVLETARAGFRGWGDRGIAGSTVNHRKQR